MLGSTSEDDTVSISGDETDFVLDRTSDNKVTDDLEFYRISDNDQAFILIMTGNEKTSWVGRVGIIAHTPGHTH